MTNFFKDSEDVRRYHPSEDELSILRFGIKKYLALPDRSPLKNKITEDVSALLEKFYPYWNQRNVRLWFNNNKNSISYEFKQTDSNSKDQETPIYEPKQLDKLTKARNILEEKKKNRENHNAVRVQNLSNPDLDQIVVYIGDYIVRTSFRYFNQVCKLI